MLGCSELACRLYYEMLDQSETWSKNKWYLNDRLVESPHTTAFFARSPADTKSKAMEEASRYWCVPAPGVLEADRMKS